VEAAVGGKLALGARLLDSTAKRLAGVFFERLSEAVAPSQETDTSPGGTRPGWFRSMWKPR
jgi:hypothetical protein